MADAHHGSVAHDVLVDLYRFHYIISFQRGVPGRIVWLERTFPDRVNATGSLAKLAIERNDLRALQDLVQMCVDFPWYRPMRKMDLSEAMHYAARHGRLEILEWCHSQTALTLECLPWTFAAAARCGQLHVLPWLQANRPESMAKFESFSMDRVAEEGRVDVFQWLEEHVGIPCTTSAMDSAALNGHLEMIQYLHEHRTEGATPLAMDMAALKGHLNVLRFLHEHRSEGCTTWAMDSAASYGQLEVVKFLHEHRHEGCTVKAMNEAAARGSMEMVQFLHTHRPEGCNKYAIRGAARFGHLEMVRFLHDTFHKQHCSRDTMVAAAEEGHLDVVKYLNENCDASSGNALVFAAFHGHLAVVEYLVEHRRDGCLVAARDKAKKGGYRDVVAFLDQYIVPGLTTCVSTNHDRKDAVRVCQRPETVAAATW